MDAALRDRKSYIMEVLTPAQDDPEFEGKLGVFGERFRRILHHDGVVSIPDNPMGRLRFGALEVMEHQGIVAGGDDVLVHVNTFHTKDDLDGMLRKAADRGIRHLLVVSGDGSPRLSKLEPEDLGVRAEVVTSVELLGYIRALFPGVFSCGVAFNQYEPPEHELEKLRRKLDAGAESIITQPVIGEDLHVSGIIGGSVPVFVEAWMSKKIELVYECVGIAPPSASEGVPYSPKANLLDLHRLYPTAGVYLAMLSFKSEWGELLPRVPSLALR